MRREGGREGGRKGERKGGGGMHRCVHACGVWGPGGDTTDTESSSHTTSVVANWSCAYLMNFHSVPVSILACSTMRLSSSL